MDRRKNNKGTKGNKGGRPPLKEEMRLLDRMSKIATPDEALLKLWDFVQNGENESTRLRALEKWLEYLYGKPTSIEIAENNDSERSEIKLPNGTIITI